MKKVLLFVSAFFLWHPLYAAIDLIHVFQLGLANDPTYQQVVAETLANHENIAINRANLLPNLSFKGRPQQDKMHFTGSQVRSGIVPPANNLRALDMKLSLSQTIFNFAQFAQLAEAECSAKQANARLNASMQDLMFRVSQAYFNIVTDEEDLLYFKKNRDVLAAELNETKKMYAAGSKTPIDVYTAESAYGSAEAGYIDAETKLATDKEFLSTITGVEIKQVAKLKETIPLISPDPQDINAWVHKAQTQNWTIQANRFALSVAKQTIKEQFAGHLPTIDAQLNYDVLATNSTASSLLYSAGASKTRDAGVLLNINVPLFSGGAVVSQTRQAKYNYRVAQQQLEAAVRHATFNAQQSYLNVIASIRKITNDRLTIKSAASSLYGQQERYKAGEATLIDVFTEQNKVIQSEMQYTANKKTYIINLLALKNAAGTLSVSDLEAINQWLV
jgi:outer membrane protein